VGEMAAAKAIIWFRGPGGHPKWRQKPWLFCYFFNASFKLFSHM